MKKWNQLNDAINNKLGHAMIINQIKNIKFSDINFSNLVMNVFITFFILFTFQIIMSLSTPEHQKIVIFDKELVFKDYLKDLKNIVNDPRNKNIPQSAIDARNQLFIKFLISDLYKYQQKNNVMIIKRSALSAPNAFLKTKFDITEYIEKQLKNQGAL